MKTRVSSLWKNDGNLENEKKLFADLEKSWNLEKAPKTWKNHGIWKNQPGKITEFFQWFETLWNQFSAPRLHFTYHVDGFVHSIAVHWFFPNLFLPYILWLISTCVNVMLYKSFLIHILIFGTCILDKQKYFWKNHGNRFRNSAGNPGKRLRVTPPAIGWLKKPFFGKS